jgi:chlorophyllide a reductase subunit Y
MSEKIIPILTNPKAASVDGLGCHSGAEQMIEAAKAANKSEVLQRYAKDYPKGPHDQPQSMCPAFGSLRVGLRMRRTSTILSGSACCVYGLTFTSHFYGAKRSVGYVPFNSESLVTGKLFEDIREAVYKEADPEKYDVVVIINLCVPTASGVPLQLLPKEINGVRIIGIDVPGFGVPTHAEAKDVLAGAMLKYARNEAEAGPVTAPRQGVSEKPTITLLGEMFPVDPVGIGMMLEPMGLAAGPVVPTREWRELYQALDCAAVAAIHPFYTASIREFKTAGRKIVGSAPIGYEGTVQCFWKRSPEPSRPGKLELFWFVELCLTCAVVQYKLRNWNLRISLPALCFHEAVEGHMFARVDDFLRHKSADVLFQLGRHAIAKGAHRLLREGEKMLCNTTDQLALLFKLVKDQKSLS